MFNLTGLFSPFFNMIDKVEKNGEPLEKIISKKPKIEEVLLHSAFKTELNNESEYLINFLKQKDNLASILFFIGLGDHEEHFHNKKFSLITSRASMVLLKCNFSITAALFSMPDLEIVFFKMIDVSSFSHSTSQGYFYEICRSMIENSDIQKKLLFSIFENPINRYNYRMIENLTFSNTLLIKLLVSTIDGLSQDRKQQTFSYIVYYFINEKFLDNKKTPIDEFSFQNVFSFFHFLSAEKISFEYKKKYILNLFNEKTIKSEKYFFQLFHLRIILLKYLVTTEQLQEFPNPGIFLSKILEISAKNKKFVVLLDGLTFYKFISRNSQFEKCADLQFFTVLIDVFNKYLFSDILHNCIFSIFQNLILVISRNQSVLKVILEFLQSALQNSLSSKLQNQRLNEMSLNFAYLLINSVEQNINNDCLEKIKVLEMRAKLHKICVFDENASNLENSVISSRSKMETILKTNDEIARLMAFINSNEENFRENSFQISDEVFSSRSSTNSQNFKKNSLLTKNDKDAYTVIEGLVQSITFSTRHSAEKQLQNEFDPVFVSDKGIDSINKIN